MWTFRLGLLDLDFYTWTFGPELLDLECWPWTFRLGYLYDGYFAVAWCKYSAGGN